jgi:hypothetical protein
MNNTKFVIDESITRDKQQSRAHLLVSFLKTHLQHSMSSLERRGGGGRGAEGGGEGEGKTENEIHVYILNVKPYLL